MASPPILEWAELLEPIPGDNPAGEKYLPHEMQEKLEKGREEEDPDDPEKKPDWPGVVRVAKQVLATTSKSLEVAARLTEGLVKLHGFAGLRDGLHLIHELLDQAWDRLMPALQEEGDTEDDLAFNLERRAAKLNWLDPPDDTSGSRFPITLRMVPVIVSGKGRFSWLDWRRVQDGKEDVSKEDFDEAVANCTLETCDAILADIDASSEELNQLVGVMESRFGSVAPSLGRVRLALEEVRSLLQDILRRKRPLGAEESDTTAESGSDGAAGDGAPRGPLTSRAEVYRQLAHAAAVLQQLEPHSPIPYLIQRAVELGSLPFPQLIKQLVRDANVLNELNREFGLKNDEASSSESSDS